MVLSTNPRRNIWAVALAVLVWAAPATATSDRPLWAALRSAGHVAVMRHALAPGTGDPAGFVLGDCRTQRNLSGEGRAQAARIGERFRANGILTARIFSSQWCRCLDTARGLELGPVRELPVLNSFFRQTARQKPQTRELREWLADQDPGEPLLLVTHQVNITALTGVYPTSGEIVVLRRAGSGELEVVGTIEPD